MSWMGLEFIKERQESGMTFRYLAGAPGWMVMSFTEMRNPCKGMCLVGSKKFNFSYLFRLAFNIQVEMTSGNLGVWVHSTGKGNSQGLSWLPLPFSTPSFWNLPPKLSVPSGDTFAAQGSQQWHLILVGLT